MNILIKLPLVLVENVVFCIFPKLRPFVEKIYNPYYRQNFKEYIEKQYNLFRKSIDKYKSLKGASLLELGPGGSIGFGLLAIKDGVSSYYAIDDGNHLNEKKLQTIYEELIGNKTQLVIAKRKVKVTKLNRDFSYRLPDSTIDIVYSCAVLEHIKDLDGAIKEMSRVLKTGGIMYHHVDLKDHIFSNKSLFFLAIPQKIFNFFFYHTGEWVNRVRLLEYKRLFAKNNLKILKLELKEKWCKTIPFYLRSSYKPKEIECLSFVIVLQKN